ncbi:MAG: GNAT family N-acetyltransferase [Clostridia bacterium]|nr:GNAT family N-acetyltransferase [Clostridia bacterium]
MLKIRRYRETDTVQLCDIYYYAIHNVNNADYTNEELEAWAPSGAYNEESYKKDTARWSKIMPFVVSEGGVALGFAELEDKGHINCFFVHHEHQGRGVGRMLVDACVGEARKLGYEKVFGEVSITEKPFFERMGFAVVKPVLCDIKGMMMKYYDMEKLL